MSLVRFSPFDDLFRTFANVGEPVGRDEWLPAVDIVENERAYEISVEVPAVARENINVSLKDGVLTVSGERSREKVDGERSHRVERQYGKFVRSFRLPENIDEDGINDGDEVNGTGPNAPFGPTKPCSVCGYSTRRT